jgi:hypothetical protein
VQEPRPGTDIGNLLALANAVMASYATTRSLFVLAFAGTVALFLAILITWKN